MGAEGAERGADTPPASGLFSHDRVGAGQAGQRSAVQGGDTGGIDAAFFREVAEVDECGGRDGAHLLRVLLGTDGAEEAAHRGHLPSGAAGGNEFGRQLADTWVSQSSSVIRGIRVGLMSGPAR